MPSSRCDNIPDIINILRTIKPKSILDVGCGFGKWGFLAREYLDVWEGNYHRKDWKIKIDAVEIFPEYVQPWHREIYDNIFIGDIAELPIQNYDLILACDVIEHLADDKVIDKLRSHAGNLIASIPLGVRPQGKLYNNEFEVHRSTWTLDKIKTYNPTSLKTHGQQALAIWQSPMCLFVADHDWANMGYLLAKSLQAVGVNAKAISFHAHPFYDETAEICTEESYTDYHDKADVIVAMHSIYKPRKPKRLFVFHGGSIYRDNSSRLNWAFNPIIEGSIIQHWDFLDKGAKNPHWLLPPVHLTIEPDYEYHGTKFAHYPRNRWVKGTGNILRVIPSVEYSDKLVTHQANLERMAKCDVCIEQLCGHEWGITALEAAALGKIVVTTFRGLKDYENQYGKCELVIANTEDELRERIKEIRTWDESQILKKKKATRKWVETYHSFESVGSRLKAIIIKEAK